MPSPRTGAGTRIASREIAYPAYDYGYGYPGGYSYGYTYAPPPQMVMVPVRTEVQQQVVVRETVRGEKPWQQFPTRVEISSANADVMFGCYLSALRQEKIELGKGWSDDDLARLDAYLAS